MLLLYELEEMFVLAYISKWKLTQVKPLKRLHVNYYTSIAAVDVNWDYLYDPMYLLTFVDWQFSKLRIIFVGWTNLFISIVNLFVSILWNFIYTSKLM